MKKKNLMKSLFSYSMDFNPGSTTVSDVPSGSKTRDNWDTKNQRRTFRLHWMFNGMHLLAACTGFKENDIAILKKLSRNLLHLARDSEMGMPEPMAMPKPLGMLKPKGMNGLSAQVAELDRKFSAFSFQLIM